MTETASLPHPLSAPREQATQSSRLRLSRWLPLGRPLPALLVVLGLLRLWAAPTSHVPRTRDLSQALAETLASSDLRLAPNEAHWLEPGAASAPFDLREPSVVFRANQGDGPADIYKASVRLSPEGRLLAVTGLYNLTETSAADEQGLVVNNQHAAWAIGDAGRFYSIHLADFGGESIPSDDDWTWLKRTQRRLANLQSTGNLDGVGWRSFKLEPSASQLVLGFAGPTLLMDANGQRVHIDTSKPAERATQRGLVEQNHHLARPGNLITWAVDRVRAAPWFGNDRMQFVKAVGFLGLDYVERFVGTVTANDGSEEIKEELGDLAKLKPVEYTDPETGWPPPPMKPILKEPLEGEGKWVSLESDPFIKTNPGAPSPFMFSFIRTDYKRPFSQTYVLLWDPRQVELHAASGTQEPKTATGETGDGLVPRKLGVVDRLVAGFNGGFQATHGEFGMMAEGVVYLPPKPYAATVAKLSDGFTAFGTWPNDEHVPENVVSFRQNMTPLTQDSAPNPYKRTWWGGVPPGWEEESRTIRSAVCLTRENFVAYIYGSSLDADKLLVAAEGAHCDYTIHLDMNPGHTGLEFYHVAPRGQLPELGDKIERGWQAQGPVPEMPGWDFMGRRMIKFMALMNFPRYISRESRDFFYLTLRHVLPGSAVPETLGTGPGWQTKGLPQHGWPLAIATATLSPDPKRPETQIAALKLDGRMLDLPAKGARVALSNEVISFVTPEQTKLTRALWWTRQGFAIAAPSDPSLLALAEKLGAAGAASARTLGFGITPEEAPGKVIVAAAGVDAGKFAVYVEIMSGHERATDARLLSSVLSELGCTEVVLFEHSLLPAIGGVRGLDGRAPSANKSRVQLVRGVAPGARRFFTDTPIVHPDVWAPLQRKRVRYFRKPSPAASASEPTAPPPQPGE